MKCAFLGKMGQNVQFLGEWGRNGHFLGEMGMINRVMAYNSSTNTAFKD